MNLIPRIDNIKYPPLVPNSEVEIIKAYQICKTFKSGDVDIRALDGVSLSIKTGEFVALTGKSGAGKSTLLYQLSALDYPTKGNVFIDGIDVNLFSEIELQEFRLNSLGYVFQDYALIPEFKAYENVAFPLIMRGLSWKRAREIAEATLDQVGLNNKYTKLPSQLSGGEQQRVAIARAVAGKPKILFADEPTANLDSSSGKGVIKLLQELNETGITIVMVTHEEEYSNACKRIITLRDGIVIEDKINFYI